MKIIISHDVDHLYGKDHWFRDMIYPKLWVRSTLQLIKRNITIKEWFLRCISCFKKERNQINDVMEFDRQHDVKSAFFFGMNQGLGMSYYPDEAKSIIKNVYDNGFIVGVHGIEYSDFQKMDLEYKKFVETVGFEPVGIRMHYVRFDDNTFDYLSRVGYTFDTTEFDKSKNGTIKNPYKVGNMWEFPLTIMDGYLSQDFESAKKETIERLEACRNAGIEYVSVLFHDYQFCDAYKDIRDWYVWLVEYLSDSDEYSFVSYLEAIALLEGNN